MTKPEIKPLKTLIEDYPALFPENFHFECDDGWYVLLKNLCHFINHSLGRWRDVVSIQERVIASGKEPLPWIADYFEEHPIDPLESFEINQIKEKFGGLSFYWSCDIDAPEVAGAVSLAEMLSYWTCEACGNLGYPGGDRWRKTYCATHHGVHPLEQLAQEAPKENSDDE